MLVIKDGICCLGTTTWSLQNAQISMEELCEIKWGSKALRIYGHGHAWMHTFWNTGIYCLNFLAMVVGRKPWNFCFSLWRDRWILNSHCLNEAFIMAIRLSFCCEAIFKSYQYYWVLLPNTISGSTALVSVLIFQPTFHHEYGICDKKSQPFIFPWD